MQFCNLNQPSSKPKTEFKQKIYGVLENSRNSGNFDLISLEFRVKSPLKLKEQLLTLAKKIVCVCVYILSVYYQYIK